MKRCILIALLLGFLGSARAGDPVKLIFETDMGNDVDDVLCQVLINKYIEYGSVDCLMMGLNKTGTAPAAFVDIVNTFYHHPDIPIGLARNGIQEPDSSSYAYIVANMKGPDGRYVYPRTVKDYDSLPDAVTLYRKTLASQSDSSVVIASVGFSTNLVQLMETGGDQWSPLDGMELISRKVKYLAVMAGNFSGSGLPEYNVVVDIPSARKVFEEWPTKVVFSPWELGVQVLYPVSSIQNDFGWAGEHHPMVDAFKNYGNTYPSDRPSWDPTTVLYALDGEKWFNVSSPVDVTVDKDGRTIFSLNPQGNRYYLGVSPAQARAIEDYFVEIATLGYGAYRFMLGENIGMCGNPANAAFMKASGLNYVETNVSGFLMPEKSEEEFAANRALAAACPLPIYSANGFFPGDIKLVGPEADLDRAVKYSETAIRRASEIGIKCLVLGSGRSRNIPDGFDRRKAEKQFLTLLKRIAPFAEKYGIIVAIEPLRTQETNLIQTVCEGADFARRAGSENICVLADFYHMTQNGEDPESLVQCADKLRHCHIAENERRTAPGVCGDDFTPFFKVLKKIKYSGRISIECGWGDQEQELPKAVETMREQMKTIK